MPKTSQARKGSGKTVMERGSKDSLTKQNQKVSSKHKNKGVTIKRFMCKCVRSEKGNRNFSQMF